MKSFTVLALFILCAIAFAEDAPADLLPCSFRLSCFMKVHDLDGEELATSRNELYHDNGNFWVWKSSFSGNEFISSIVPDHEWVIYWRPDNGKVYRQDYTAQKCYTLTFDQQPVPYDWIQSKSYGVVWYSDLVDWKGQEATLYTAVIVGTYDKKMEYESEANFYVTNSDKTIVFINGTLSANKREIQVTFESEMVSFEHNEMLDPKLFAVSEPNFPTHCDTVGAPAAPSSEFQNKCYVKSGASMLTVSWIAVVAMLVALLRF